MAFKIRKDIPRRTTFAYRRPPVSGNIINGLGERQRRQARHVFHNIGDQSLPWDRLDRLFSFVSHWRVVYWILRNVWTLRRETGRAAESRADFDSHPQATAEIKNLALELGASLVGVTRVRPSYAYEGREIPYQFLICIGVAMDRQQMLGVPDRKSAAEVMRSYARVGKIVCRLAAKIRHMGWPARAYGNPNSGDLQMIPAAIDAGLGQLGKHGSMISKQFGSNFRLGAVATDLPLVPDERVDHGVDDFCSLCNICVRDCPVDAIFPDKQMVRGESKWYVDFDRCIYYFCETEGCAICIETCPWSEPGKGDLLSRRILNKCR